MIEASSPLAAMQPQAYLGHCGFRPDGPSSYASFAAAKSFGNNSFNFKDLSMKRSPSDYFSLKPVRGSSPTASLAADLSQNFHIDQSPQLPTPRRALFPNSIFAPAPQEGHLNLTTTPPIPTSSPGAQDAMDLDLSPLPHKAPFGSVAIQLQSPTPEPTPAESPMSVMASPPVIPTRSETLSVPPERRKPGPLRPSLCRAKGYSTGTLPQRPAPESQGPQFQFLDYMSNKPATSSSLSLSEIFAESPVQEKQVSRLPPAPFAAPRSRNSLIAGNSRNGSPIGGHVRKGSNPLVRPRKQFRRSLSMFEHPEEVMNREKERMSPPPPLLPSIMDNEAPHVPQLPHFVPDGEAGALPRITKETMVEVLDGRYNSSYEKLVVIDCRFEYEYNGGHIDGAVNFNDKEQLSSQLFTVEPTTKALLIFHCEYSAHRAPLMAKFIRNRDRTVNADRYPALTYPEVYILDGGYSTFFKDYRARCFPQNYVEMDAKEHVLDCERGLGKVKQRSKLVRAQTFAFGQHSPSIDSSPTAMGRSRLDSDMGLDMGLEYTPVAGSRISLGALRGMNQRMASY
ncbi:m-phase inducer phosphatase [Exophiala xenobiotica]|nr:m-phase inducer phosphatase [Exophiala xenobiotica]KAK5248314.1 m-phase inducer phosphatase [Exophiala xenobiotica]KAK5347853.1 m-phase inducer phosphatase [Exophiala xenobiotica]KAK5369681.1 m-phase inducer phosphatase [Exophiala xenobiotica]KAK5371714.1 m-phase inducer phosphatase [Exophiala xenobiotica]